MFKILNILTKPQVLSACNCSRNNARTFLSPAYYCKEVWDSRLNSPILQKVNPDLFYHELDQRFQRTREISAVDVDVFANSIKDDLFIDELLDLVHKLRLSAETGNSLNSTSHAVIRILIDHKRVQDLLQILDDRLNYGVFLDDYTANILMDTFWKSKNFVAGAIVASQMMLQEDLNHPVTVNFALLHCYNYLLTPGDWPQPPSPEEPEEEVKVRVKYLRNPYDDEHFDLRDPLKIVGKTLAQATQGKDDSLQRSFRIVGLALFGKEDLVRKEISQSINLVKEIVDVVPEEMTIKQELMKVQLISENVQSVLQKRVAESVALTSEKDIANQCDLFTRWESERLEALQEQKRRVLRAERLAEVERLKQTLEDKEQKLWFFENEEKIELAIEEAVANTPAEQAQKTKAEEETYIPPEVASRKT